MIGAAWLTAAGHGRWAGSPRGPEAAVAEGHIDLGASWCGCGRAGDSGASVYWVRVD